MPVRFTRELHGGEHGPDVEGVGRALARAGFLEGIAKFAQKAPVVRRTYGTGKQAGVNRARAKTKRPANGIYDRVLHNYLVSLDAFDAYAASLMLEYVPVPVLIEPDQGFESLDRSLWEVYSNGRRRGLTDLGTYNPDSILPSGRPSDHAVYPAMAFDLGIEPDTGWQNLKARTYAIWTAGRPEVEYTILGNRIWRSWYRVWGAYYSGGHLNHVHVSGRR